MLSVPKSSSLLSQNHKHFVIKWQLSRTFNSKHQFIISISDKMKMFIFPLTLLIHNCAHVQQVFCLHLQFNSFSFVFLDGNLLFVLLFQNHWHTINEVSFAFDYWIIFGAGWQLLLATVSFIFLCLRFSKIMFAKVVHGFCLNI